MNTLAHKQISKPILCALLSCFLLNCHSQDKTDHGPVDVIAPNQLRVSGETAFGLKLAKAEVKEMPDTLNVMGRISATEDRTTVVPARVSGRIETVAIASGEFAKAGQVLATLYSPDYATAREEYIQAIKQAKGAGVEGSDFSNIVKMSRKRLAVIGLNESDIKALDTAPLVDQDSPAMSGVNLVVRATHSGAVITKNAIVGNQVNAGDTLFTIADLNKVWFLGDLYPEDLPKVKKDQEVTVESVPGSPPLHGKVSFISPVMDPTARTIKIRALIDNPKLELRADMYVQGGLVLSKKKALLIPTSSIARDQDITYVFRVNKQDSHDGKLTSLDVEKMKVEIGAEQAGQSAIVAGLKDGDQIVTEGALLLNAALENSEK